MPRARAACTGGSDGASLRADDNFGDVVAGDPHFHRADLDFEVIVVDFLVDSRGAPIDFSLTVSPSETCFTSLG